MNTYTRIWFKTVITSVYRYSHYTVSLAYQVISMWFLKCKLVFRKKFVKFIIKVCILLSILAHIRQAGASQGASRNFPSVECQWQGQSCLVPRPLQCYSMLWVGVDALNEYVLALIFTSHVCDVSGVIFLTLCVFVRESRSHNRTDRHTDLNFRMEMERYLGQVQRSRS